MALLEKVRRWEWVLSFQQTCAFPSSLSLHSVFRSSCELSAVCATMPLLRHHGLSPSKMVSHLNALFYKFPGSWHFAIVVENS